MTLDPNTPHHTTHMKIAAVFAAFFCWITSVAADEITLRSNTGGLTLSGKFIGFDGDYLHIATDYGPLTVLYDEVDCSGAACPDRANYVPVVRVSGAARMSEVLLPALISGFARASGYSTELQTEDLSQFSIVLSRETQSVAVFSFRATTTDEGFADLFAHEADIVMSLREARPTEVAIARDVGVGNLNDASQIRMVALDALVPVISPLRGMRSVSLRELSDILAGQMTDWAELGEAPATIVLHLLEAQHGIAQRIVDQIIVAGGNVPTDLVERHDSIGALTSALAADRNGLGVVPFAAAGRAKPLALRDACGYVTSPRVAGLKAEDYPLTAPLFLYFPDRRQHPIVGDLLRWLRTPDAQLVVRRSGFIDQGAVPIPLDAQGQRLANAIDAAGDEVTLAELQRMLRVLNRYTRQSMSFRNDVGSTRFDAQSRSNLLDLAQAIRDGRYDNRQILLAGFSEGRGDAIANRDLSSARAEAVKRALQDLLGGAFPAAVTVETAAFGEALPMGCDDTEWGRQTNRRVELWVAD